MNFHQRMCAKGALRGVNEQDSKAVLKKEIPEVKVTFTPRSVPLSLSIG